MSRSPIPITAAVMLALEGAGLGLVVGWELIALLTGDVAELATALALMVLVLGSAVALIAFAVAVARDVSWGRSGGIVAQLLILSVALGAVTGAFADVTVGLLLAAPAILTLVLLVLAARDSARRQRAGEGETPGDPARGDAD